MSASLDNLDSDLLELLISTLESQLVEAETRVNEAQDEVIRIEAKIDRVKAKLEPKRTVSSKIKAVRTLSGRMKKGEAERLISEYLQSRNGTGTTVIAAMKATNTTYGTAYRTLHSLAERGAATEHNKVFHWIRVRQPDPKNLQAGNEVGEGEET